MHVFIYNASYLFQRIITAKQPYLIVGDSVLYDISMVTGKCILIIVQDTHVTDR